MREKIKTILCVCLIVIGLPLIITMVFQGDGIWSPGQQEDRDGDTSGSGDGDELAALVGLLAQQIPADYEREAIKAQAVIVRTNYEYARQAGNELPEGLSVSEQRELFGRDNYARCSRLLQDCLAETGGEVVTYGGEVVEAPFFQVSAGWTRDGEKPYLKSVESPQDVTSEDFLQVEFYSPEELAAACNQAFPESALAAENVMEQIEITGREDSGYIKNIRLGNTSVSGEELRNGLGLPSAHIYLRQVDDRIRVVTKGMGHGLGLSVYGANELAKEGMDYQEILKTYYTGIEIKETE